MRRIGLCPRGRFGVANSDGVQQRDSSSMDYSGFEKNGCLGGEKDQCLLGCPPLS